MASPAEIIADLGDVGELLSAQVNAGQSRDEVLENLFNSWAARLLSATKISPKGKAQITNAVQEGPWSASQKKELANVVLGTEAASKVAARRPTQKLATPENFITMSAFVKLRGKVSRASRMSLLASEMRAIGVSNPDEHLLFRLTQIIALCEDNFEFTQELVWQCMDEIQVFIKSVPRPTDLPYEQYYPGTPDMLHADLKKHAYGKGPLPVSVDLPELASVLGSAKKRGRPDNKGKTPKMPKWMRAVPEEHRSAIMTALKSTTSESPKGTVPQAPAVSGASGSTHQPSAFTADTFRFQIPTVKPEKKTVKKESSDEEDDAPEGSDSESEENADPKSILEFEQKMLSARVKAKARAPKNMKKRPAAASAAVKSVLKKPSACAKAAVMKSIKEAPKTSVSKKPASKSKPLGMKNAVWKNVHSQIWHKVKNELFKKTGDMEASKQAASRACTRAKAQFLKGTLRL